MMKKSILLAAAVLAAGCASSERMMRLSDSYEAPRTSRIGGRQWSGASEMTDGTQINVWPLFVRSNRYYSVLWPLFDCDPYGVAVRPFFNQEGNDYSILFPCAVWNAETGSGWALNTYWYGRSFGCFPLFHDSNLGGYALPLTFWKRDSDGFALISIPLMSGYQDKREPANYCDGPNRWMPCFGANALPNFGERGHFNFSTSDLPALMRAFGFKGDARNPTDRAAFYQYLKQEIPGFNEQTRRTALVINLLLGYQYDYRQDRTDFVLLYNLLGNYSRSPKEKRISALLALFWYKHLAAADPAEALKAELIDIVCDEIDAEMAATNSRKTFEAELKKRCEPLREKLAKYDLTLSDNPDWKELLALAKCPMTGGASEPAETNWRVFWILATGHTRGDCEERQVLWFLYNYKREGENSRNWVFPFVTVERDADSCETSWIWNRFMSIKNGANDTSGYFMFIPW
ncbi:MAG: hypothetical protein AB7F40_08825 [Victivallaceae bacterium]